MGNNIKRTIAVLSMTALCAVVFAQEQQIIVNGYGKSGILWNKTEQQGMDNTKEDVSLGSKDDAGGGQGRFRLDIDYLHGDMGIKTRIQWDNWGSTAPGWSYAFAFGNFFNDQLTVSVGKLGSSPWGTGGPEMWKELEENIGGGMRTEIKPAIIPGLNAGFILNWFNKANDQGWPADKPLTLVEILRESVLGVSYSHDLFLVRFAYRFDGEYDRVPGNTGVKSDGEDSLLYRVEEKVLKNYIPGLQVWALGFFEGLYVEDKAFQLLQNWLFAQYDPENFTAQVRFGYETGDKRSILHLRPSFYYKFFDNLLNVGASFWFGQDFGENKVYPGSPYSFIELEPKVQINFASSYIAFAYNWRRAYDNPNQFPAGAEPIRQTQWMNLRFCIQM
jgi:hypothetical protein